MRSWRFLVTRRWIVFFLVVVVLAYGTWWLGRWQFHRLSDRQHDNAIINATWPRRPRTSRTCWPPVARSSDDDEWLHVQATGTYDDAHTVVIRYQTRDGDAGRRTW